MDVTRFHGALAVVILPTLNEEEGLPLTLKALPFDRFEEAGRRVQPLIIDGGSTDGTLEVAQKWDIPVLPQTSRGKGGAMLEAIAWVHRLGIPFVVVLDADATYPPDRILPALNLLEGGTDLVIGIRRPAWGPPSDLKDLIHRVGNVGMSYTASLLTRRPILDLCSGFWGVSTSRFMELGLDDSSFAIEAELVLKSVRRGFTIHQIPVDYQERVGQTKLRALRDGSRIIRTILLHARRSRPDPDKTPAPAPWGRDVLSIGIALGRSGALLECAPSEALEAGQLARYLLRDLPETRVLIDSEVSTVPGSADPPGKRGTVDDRSTVPVASLFTVTLPSAGPDGGEGRWAKVSIGSERRPLSIELLAEPNETRADPAAGLWSRSGGWIPYGPFPRGSSPSLMVLTSRLNFRPENRQRTLLAANGYEVTEDAAENHRDSDTSGFAGLHRVAETGDA
jgi:hypothetical protein